MALAAHVLLSLALGGVFAALFSPRGDERSGVRKAAAFLAFAAFAFVALTWAGHGPVDAGEVARPFSPAAALVGAAVGLALALAAGLLCARGAVFPALLLGLFAALAGTQAHELARAATAWSAMRWFAGPLAGALLRPVLAAALALAAAALTVAELAPYRARIVTLLLAAWAAAAQGALWHLRAEYGLGAATTLASDAGLPPAARSERVSLAWLFPAAGKPVRFEELRANAAGVDVSPESLERLETYLRARDFKGVFAKQGLDALRQGWLFWWEADRALDAAMVWRPGRFPPDYKTALGLIRSGPMDESRYRRLETLAQTAKPRRMGFEDVNTSQIIFEGFASSYARFGDEEDARNWLLLVENLWPINDKKLEVNPLESVHDASVEGRVLLDGLPASGVKVGLFFAASSTATVKPGYLSQSAFPDDSGRFQFRQLAPGRYHLALMGLPSQLRGRVLNSPGYFELTPEAPAVRLDPIRVER